MPKLVAEQQNRRLNHLNIWSRLSNVVHVMKPLLGTGSVLCYKLLYKLRETNAFDCSNLLVVGRNIFDDSVNKTFDSLWKNKENDDGG